MDTKEVKQERARVAREGRERKKQEFEQMKQELAELKSLLARQKETSVQPTARKTADEFVEALNKQLAGGPTLDDLESMPLETYTDYLRYNETLREMRLKTRKKIRPFKYPPLELVPKQKVKLTRTKNKSMPININIKDSKNFVHYKETHHHGDVVEMPHCIIEKVNSLATPVYKEVKHPDGTSETVLDYWDNVYSCQAVVE